MAAAAALVLALPARALDLSGLMTLLATRKSGEARFTEQRWVSGLDQPQMASGRLSFVAPDRFTRQQAEPRAETMVVEGNRVTIERNRRKREMALDTAPELTAVVEAIRGTLGGNAATLQKYFTTSVGGEAAKWTLTLTPLDARLAAQVSQLRIEGRLSDVRSVEVQLADGDRSLMQIEPVAAARSGAP